MGRDHDPWYRAQRPGRFGDVLTAARHPGVVTCRGVAVREGHLELHKLQPPGEEPWHRPVNRAQAEADAQVYYAQLEADTAPNDKLDPRRIKDWVETRQPPAPMRRASREIALEVRLERPAEDYLARRLSVLPLSTADRLSWIDPAGYAVAHCNRPADWDDQSSRFRFELSVDLRQVTGEPYLPHRRESP